MEKGDLDGALRYAERALKIFVKFYGPDNPQTPAVSKNLEAIRKARR